jgi:hypothetical protein
MVRKTEVVLILGSGPNALETRNWPRAWFDRIVAINNAWRVRPDWDDLVFPEDFPKARRPRDLHPGQRLVEADQFVPTQNAYGGFVYAGGTMAFTAGYWALKALRPRVMAFMGCDMVYPQIGKTHFYGEGTADPLRADVTLQDLGAKSARLGLLAAAQGCRCVNLSRDRSELLFEKVNPARLRGLAGPNPDPTLGAPILNQEDALGYFVPTGRYWEEANRFDAAALASIDAAWRAEWSSVRLESRAA